MEQNQQEAVQTAQESVAVVTTNESTNARLLALRASLEELIDVAKSCYISIDEHIELNEPLQATNLLQELSHAKKLIKDVRQGIRAIRGVVAPAEPYTPTQPTQAPSIQPAGLVLGKPCYISAGLAKLIESYVIASDANDRILDAIMAGMGDEYNRNTEDKIDTLVTQPISDVGDVILDLIKEHIYEALSDRYMLNKESYTL